MAQLQMQSWCSLKKIIEFFPHKEQNRARCNSVSVPIVSSMILA